MEMKVSIGSDHRGIDQRAKIADAIESAGHEVDDRGTDSTEACDYPDVASDVARRVSGRQSERGILICGTGIGVSIAANKIPGIRAAVCHDLHTVEMSRRHNDANVLCMAADIEEPMMRDMVAKWLATSFDGGRHERRVGKITSLENRVTAG